MPLEVAGLVSSFTTLNSIAKAMLGLHDAAQLNPKIIEFQQAMIEANSRVMAVQQEHSGLSARVQELEKENARLKDWSAEKEKYALRPIGMGPTVFAYVEKGFVGNFENAEKFCQNCFDQDTKSRLQGEKIKVGRRDAIICHRCGARDEFDCWETYPHPKPSYGAAPIHHTT